MRSAFLVLVCALALATATRVPPFTYADYWDQFHVQGGCFNDVYLYDENLDDDAAIHYVTRVLMVGDFSYPYIDDEMYYELYESEFTALNTFASELSSMAFPISVFETCDPVFDQYNSLQVEFMAYSVLGMTNYFYSTEWRYLNDPTQMCLTDLLADIEAPWDDLQAIVDTYIETGENIWFVYDEMEYAAGVVEMVMQYLDDNGPCKPDEMCYVLFARVNPISFEFSVMYEAVMALKAYGYQIITVDAQMSKTASVATWTASEPQERFAHLLTSPISPRPEYLGTKLVQAVRGGNSGCLSYGMHQMLTFDGYGYTQNELGDFVIAKDLFANTFEVQIRNNPCDRSSADHNVACTDGLAIRVGARTIAFYYDRMDDLLAVTINGELAKPGYLLYDEFQAFIIRKYPAGYEVGVYTQMPFTYIRAEFLFTGSVAVYPAPSLRYALGGLCGTFDNCALDEFYTVDEKFTADQAYFVQSWRAHGGASLFEQPSYMLDKPFIARPAFIDNAWVPWVFDPANVQPYDMEYCAMYNSGALYDTCLYLAQVGATIPKADMDMILAMFPQNSRLSDLALWDPIAPVCADSCENGYSRMGGFNMIDINCTTICDSQMADLEGIAFRFPDTTTDTYKVKIPVANSNMGRQAFFAAPLGGDYLVRVRSFDCCTESAPLDFIVSVDCTEKQVLINIPSDVEIFIDEFALPLVELESVLEDDSNPNVHIMWSFLASPDGYAPELLNPFNQYASFIPQAMGDYVLQVLATDGCSVSADYVTVTVNCYNRDYVLNSKDSDSMVFTHTTNWQDSYFTTSWLSLDKSCLAPIGATIAEMFTEFPWTFAPVAWKWDIERVTPDALLVDIMDMTDTTKDYVVYWEINELVHSDIIYYDDFDPIPYKLDEEVIVPQREALGLHQYAVIRAEARIDITETQVEYYEQTEGTYNIYAFIESAECFIYTELTYEAQVDGTFTSKLSVWAQNAYEDPIFDYNADGLYMSFGYDWVDVEQYDWLMSQNPDGTFVYSDVTQFIYDNFHFHTGHCPGQYKISVELEDTFACPTTSGSDEYLLDITCIRRPQPLPILPCYELTFDYVAGAYPTAYMLGYDSVVPAYRDMDFAWYFFEKKNDTLDSMAYVDLNVIDIQNDPDWDSDWDTWEMSEIDYVQPYLNWYMDHPDALDFPFNSEKQTYYAFLYATDHCMNFYEWVEVTWHCRPAPVMNFVQQDAAVVFTYPTVVSKDYNGNKSYPPQTAWYYGAHRTFMDCDATPPTNVPYPLQWDDILHDVLGLGLPSYGCAVTSQTDGTVTAVAAYPGTYTLTLSVYDECTYNTIDVSMPVTCDAAHARSNFVWTVVDELTTTNRATGYTYAITNGVNGWLNINNAAHTLTAANGPTGNTQSFYWCDYDDLLDEIDLSTCNNNPVWTIDYATTILDIDILTSTRFHRVLITYNGCEYAVTDYYVTYTCGAGAVPTPPTWAVATGFSTIFGFNYTLYDIVLHTGTDTSSWTGIGCDIYSTALNNDATCNLQAGITPGACLPGAGGDMHIGLGGCMGTNGIGQDQINNIQIWTEYYDLSGCAPRASNKVTINLRCWWDISATAVTDATDDTVTFGESVDGEFDTVCVYVPDANFRWTKPWDEDFTAVPNPTANPDPTYGCNFQSCVDGWFWDFGTTPELSVFQNKTVNYTVSSPSSTRTGSGEYTDCSSPDYDWLNDTVHCGLGYYYDFSYTETISYTFERKMATYLVSAGYQDGSDVTFANDELENPYLAGCFRPDVEGDYDLTLTLFEDCKFRETQTSVTVTAVCPELPDVQVVNPADNTVIMGQRFAFDVTVPDQMLAYEWSMWYCENSVVEDITEYVTNAHAPDASFIPIAQGCHRWQLIVWDDCIRTDGVSYTVVEGTFQVACSTSSAPVVPLAPTYEGIHEVIYSVVDFNGQGMLPIHEYVVNKMDDPVIFNWKIAGFTPRYATWEDVYPVASDYYTSQSILVPPAVDKNVAENFGTTSTPALILLAILSLFLLF